MKNLFNNYRQFYIAKLRYWLIVGLLFSVFFPAKSQVADTTKQQKFTVIPIAFYTPETKFGFGAATIYTFKAKGSNLESQVQGGFAYSTINQLLLYTPFSIFTQKYRYQGELGFYRYTYKFFGTANEVPFDYEEDYKVQFPRVRFDVLRNLSPFAVGLSLVFDSYKTLALEDGKLLQSGKIAGGLGATYLGVGPTLIYDTRDNSFFPGAGYLFQGKYILHPKLSESYFEFQKLNLNVAAYKTFFSKWILASQLGFEKNNGNVPFYQMANLGGRRVMRGYYESRFRDLTASFAQIEIRYLPKRLGFTVFSGIGWIGNQVSNYQLQQSIYTYGAGLRYQLTKESKLNVRLDAGFTPQGTVNYYFTFLEAF